MNFKGLVLMYIKDGKNPLGTDYTIITNLKTLRGVRNRYQVYMRYMKNKGCSSYIVVPYHVWYNEEIENIIKNYNHYKL